VGFQTDLASCSQNIPAVRLAKAVVSGSGSGTVHATDHTRGR